MKRINENRIGSYCISCLSELKQDSDYGSYFYCKEEGCMRFGLLTYFCYDRDFIKSMENK